MMTTNLTKRINESICAVGIPVLRRHRAQVTKRPWKRALSSASLCASLTIEAALSLTLFMFTVILLSVPMEILDTQRKVQTVLEVTGRELGWQVYRTSHTVHPAELEAFWTGILEIGRRAGLIEQLSAGMRPVLHFLFPRIPAGHPALSSMAANMIANMLGLGWAATPAGLTAMKELEELEEERRAAGDPAAVTQGTASDEMCTFLVVNISSLQLIPINMIAYRSQYGSTHPLAVAGPAFLATCISTLAGVAVCRVMCRRKQYKSIKKDGWK